MAADVGLPPGFELDQPAAGGLPPGFELDAPAATPPAAAPQPNRLLDAAVNLARSMATKGPLFGLMSEGMRQGQGLLNNAAYDVGGKVTDWTGSPEAGFAANVATQAIPAILAGGPAKVLGAPAMETGATKLMQSALKPSMKALKTGKADPAIRTLLNEGITISKGGVEKLQGKVDALDDAISAALKQSGATVDKGAVASRLQDVINRIEKTSLNPQSRVAEVQKIYDEVLTNTALPNKIPVEQANKIKSGIYTLLKEKYGQLGSDTVEAQKALARGLKEEISTAVPGVGEMTKKESELLNALKLAEHRALQTGNKDIGGLSWLSLNPAAWVAFMADRSPAFKSAVARILHSGREQIPAAAARAATAAAVSNEQ